MAFMPEEQTLLMVVHSVVSDSLASRAACRAGAWPTPAESTLPIQHCSTDDESTPAFERAPVIAAAPSCGAVSGARLPLKPPIGVRTALTMQTSRGEAAVARPRRSSERPSIITAPPRAASLHSSTTEKATPHKHSPPLCVPAVRALGETPRRPFSDYRQADTSYSTSAPTTM